MRRATFLNGGDRLQEGERLAVGPERPTEGGRPRAAPPLERSSRPVKTALAGVATAVAFLLPVGLASGWPPLLLVHVVGQVIVALMVGTMLLGDRRIPQVERLLWAAGILFLAPIFATIYAWRQALRADPGVE